MERQHEQHNKIHVIMYIMIVALYKSLDFIKYWSKCNDRKVFYSKQFQISLLKYSTCNVALTIENQPTTCATAWQSMQQVDNGCLQVALHDSMMTIKNIPTYLLIRNSLETGYERFSKSVVEFNRVSKFSVTWSTAFLTILGLPSDFANAPSGPPHSQNPADTLCCDIQTDITVEQLDKIIFW